MNSKGVTLLELVIGSAVAALVAWLAFGFLSSTSRVVEINRMSSEIGANLLLAQKLVRRIGRLATSCARVAGELRCSVDFTSPPSGVLTPVRVLLQGQTLLYQIQAAPGVWQTRQSFGQINNFTVCDSALIAANRCPIQPAALNLVANAANPSYFRYQVTGTPVQVGNNVSPGRSYTGAFTVRNQAAFDPTVAFHWIYRRTAP